jgi:hypothetical protein
MRMRALPFDGDFLLVLHTPLVERPHDVPDLNPSSEFEPIRMCAHCRRVRSHDDAAWYWVPRYLQPHDVKISHGLCEPCAAYYPY